MTTMLGRYTRPWCPICRHPAGLDCADSSPSKRTQRQRENRRWRRDADDELATSHDIRTRPDITERHHT